MKHTTSKLQNCLIIGIPLLVAHQVKVEEMAHSTPCHIHSTLRADYAVMPVLHENNNSRFWLKR
jgi:hypothetical protein